MTTPIVLNKTADVAFTADFPVSPFINFPYFIFGQNGLGMTGVNYAPQPAGAVDAYAVTKITSAGELTLYASAGIDFNIILAGFSIDGDIVSFTVSPSQWTNDGVTWPISYGTFPLDGTIDLNSAPLITDEFISSVDITGTWATISGQPNQCRLPGPSNITFAFNSGGDVIGFEITDSGIDEISCLTFDAGFTGVNTQGAIAVGSDYVMLYGLNTVGGQVLNMVDFTPQSYPTPPVFDNFSITFDDADLNTAVTNFDFYANAFDDLGWTVTVFNQAGYFANTRYLYIPRDRSGYTEITLSGSPASEALISANGMSGYFSGGVFIGIGNDGANSFLLGAQGVATNYTTKNPQPVALPCQSPCIPFIKER